MAANRSLDIAEQERRAWSGWVMLAALVVWFAAALAVLASMGPAVAAGVPPTAVGARFWLGLLLVVGGVFLCFGFFTLQPNEARVLILFGSYKGSVRESGFHWANPLYSRHRGKVPVHPSEAPPSRRAKLGMPPTGAVVYQNLSTTLSLRAHNFNSDTLKVNDKRGNPVEIAAVVVWRVEDTAQAAFDVEDYETYVQVQSESAIRSIASLYAYDHGEDHETTLRGEGDEVALALKKELQVRLAKAGVRAEDARLTHLAYAPEIAPAMLRRQQAEAVIAAREKIVLGAVSMVEMALNELARKDVVKLGEERKAAMVSNLLVVLCGTEEAAPVINTGTLYG
jgi:regulator of protease activity HflC (stomatin/prohibitin superfamily)